MADDIEEIGKSFEKGESDLRNDKSLIFPKKSSSSSRHDHDVDEAKSVVGTQKIWLKTYGCSHNVSDSEYMEGILMNYGFRITPNQDDADLWLLNSCTVKDPSQAAFMHLVNKAKETQRPVVVAGCVSQADRNLPGLEDVSVVGISQIDRVVEVVESTLQGNTMKLLTKKALPKLDLPKIRKNELIEIVPLSTGCLGSCTYCKTKQARGTLGSYAPDAIVERIRKVVAEGVSEVWLSSEDTGAYGRDIHTDIAQLLRAIVDVLPQQEGEGEGTKQVTGGVMLRLGMTNPPYMLEHLAAVAEILKHPNVFSFLHVPVQSGSNVVLEGMNREYTVEEFRRVVDYLQEHVPDLTIATDIICGFPNELEQDFDQTLALIQHYKFAVVNISQFYPRPGTPAAKMRRIPTQVVKDRSRRLTDMFMRFTPYTSMVGRRVKVWFNTEVSDDGRSVGHTKAYIKVLVAFDSTVPGNSCLVDLLSADRFHVEGAVVAESKRFSERRAVAGPSGGPARSSGATDDKDSCDGDGACADDEDGGAGREGIAKENGDVGVGSDVPASVDVSTGARHGAITASSRPSSSVPSSAAAPRESSPTSDGGAAPQPAFSSTPAQFEGNQWRHTALLALGVFGLLGLALMSHRRPLQR